MTVKRYDMRQIFDGRMVMLDVRDGAFVSHDDYSTLLAERENLNQQVVNLAVENAELKCAFTITDETDTDDAENEFHDVAKYEPGPIEEIPGGVCNQREAIKAVVAKLKPETPTTDAAITNIQAQGVEKFAEHLSGLNITASETSVREFAAQLRKGASNE